MANWTIRRAEHRDANALSVCMDAAYAPYAARINDLPPLSADCAEEIVRYQVWVAEIENDVVGGLVLVPEEGFMLLANVAVHLDCKGVLGWAGHSLRSRKLSRRFKGIASCT